MLLFFFFCCCCWAPRTEALLSGVHHKYFVPSTLLKQVNLQQRFVAADQGVIPSSSANTTSSPLFSSHSSSDDDDNTSGMAVTVTPSGVSASPVETMTLGETESAIETTTTMKKRHLKTWQSRLTRAGMLTYIAAMCIALPLTLIPQKLVYMLGFMTKKEKEHYAVATAAFCARWLLRLVPFCRLTMYPHHQPNPVESVWVCNHSSLLDVFIMLAADRQLRGRTRRPIKIVYWKQLEKNPICNLLFKQAGFIPVQMAANGHGENNDYDKASFKKLLKDSKQAFEDGFDIGLLPEGQLNPTPEKGLLPVFSGAFTLARMSRRPIQMISLSGVHDLWHPLHGMHCIGRHIKLRTFPYMFRFTKSSDFVDTFKAFVGHFAMYGQDLSEEEQDSFVRQNLLPAK